MYEVRVEGCFSATHRVRLADGSREPVHGHDWRVTVVLADRNLDDAGMVVDFGQVRASLAATTGELHFRDLNDHPWFEHAEPTAECVARVIFDRMSREAQWGAKVGCVEVTEAPGCTAAYTRGDCSDGEPNDAER